MDMKIKHSLTPPKQKGFLGLREKIREELIERAKEIDQLYKNNAEYNWSPDWPTTKQNINWWRKKHMALGNELKNLKKKYKKKQVQTID
jgi:hypothetical protein